MEELWNSTLACKKACSSTSKGYSSVKQKEKKKKNREVCKYDAVSVKNNQTTKQKTLKCGSLDFHFSFFVCTVG